MRQTATARAHSNIAFIKYWGNRDSRLRLPANSSLSMNLAALHTTTSVTWRYDMRVDQLWINGQPASEAALRRASAQLDLLRQRLGIRHWAEIRSENNFPMGTGIASSASAFAALTVAAVRAADADLTEGELSRLARRGSGSAARSVPGGFVEWRSGRSEADSCAESIAPPEHWPLTDVIAVLSHAHKPIDSTAGHALADSSPLQAARVKSADERLARAKAAILGQDFEMLAEVTEADSNIMHAVMMTSAPPLLYWQPGSLAVMQAVRDWRERDGLQVCYTLDAGPNVHCICAERDAGRVAERLGILMPGIDILRSGVGPGASVIEPNPAS